MLHQKNIIKEDHLKSKSLMKNLFNINQNYLNFFFICLKKVSYCKKFIY